MIGYFGSGSVQAGLRGKGGSGSSVQASAANEIEPNPESPSNMQKQEQQAVQSPIGPGAAPGTTIPGTSALQVGPLAGSASTGRSEPANLNKQLEMQAVQSNPEAGTVLPIRMSDPNWPAAEGWAKMTQNVNGIEIHYVRNANTGATADFKFK